jgi:hypothetical protein
MRPKISDHMRDVTPRATNQPMSWREEIAVTVVWVAAGCWLSWMLWGVWTSR